MIDGLQTEWLDTGRNPKKRKRYLALDIPDTQSVTALSADWRQLLTQCVKNGENSRWQTWLKIAGISRKTLLEQHLVWLLKNGWVCVFEKWDKSDWWPYRVELQHVHALRHSLGLPNLDAQMSQWQLTRNTLQELAQNNQHLTLQVALSDLDAMPATRAIARANLVQSLLAWAADERVGTYRDFSLFARAATKEISISEWVWLDTHFDLTVFNIEQHTPLLYISANLCLQTTCGVVDLSVMPDFAALTPATIKEIKASSGSISTWILVENRTSFERVARNRQAYEGVIWLPGYPPSWWKEAVSHLIKNAPAPAKIACDPDPAGIAIALSVIALWCAAGQDASAWRMTVEELQSLPSKKALTDLDEKQLASLLKQDLPLNLKSLAEYMALCKQKGEQEGYL